MECDPAYTNADLSQSGTQSKSEIIDSGHTGDCTWTFDNNGVLTISGNGKMKDYNFHYDGYHFWGDIPPWFLESELITSLEITCGVTSIGNCAFSYCVNLSSVTIPDSVTSIGASAFCDCYALASVAIPDSVTSIQGFAFCNCSHLKRMIIPNGVPSIEIGTFKGCLNLKRVRISKEAEISPLAFDPYPEAIICC